MSTKRRTVEAPRFLAIILEDIKKAIPRSAGSPHDIYERVAEEVPRAPLNVVADMFHLRIEKLLRRTSLRGAKGPDAARLYADLFELKSALESIATVTNQAIQHLLSRRSRITPAGLFEFWRYSASADLVKSRLPYTDIASRTLRINFVDPQGEDSHGALDNLYEAGAFFRSITRRVLEEDQRFWRIRNCWHCKNIFWAGRVDKVTCSQACGNASRQSFARRRRSNKSLRYRTLYRSS